MILSLSIKHFVLIEQINIEFDPSLNLITGITGGGKSLVLKALDFLLGARPSTDLIQPGQDHTEVSAVFKVNQAVQGCLDRDFGIITEDDDTVVIRRQYRRDKTNLCYINASSVRVGDLKQVGDMLIDYLAQNHQLHLQQPAEQLAILDEAANAAPARAAFSTAYETYRHKADILRQSEQERENRKASLDELRDELSELKALALESGEDEELKQQIAVQEHGQNLLEAFQKGINGLYEGEGAAYDALADIERVLSAIDDLPGELQEISDQVTEISDGVRELAARLQAFADDAAGNDYDLDQLQERYYALQEIKHKYARDLDGLIAYQAALPQRVQALEELVTDVDTLNREVEAAWKDVYKAGKALDGVRRKAVSRFEKELLAELASLGMEGARFAVGLETRVFDPGNVSASGFNRVEFMFSANPGIAEQPVREVASGGELSRIMLAVQVIIGGTEFQPVLIFDEIDSEIGGRLGSVIGNKMKQIAAGRQVLCITHLPQLACYGDRHFKITKQMSGNATTVALQPLEDKERVEELAQMLHGESHADEHTFNEVRVMLERARNE